MKNVIEKAILLGIIVLAAFLYWRLGVLWRRLGMRGRPLEIEDPPTNIAAENLAKSHVRLGMADGNRRTETITFVTEKATVAPMVATGLNPGHAVLSCGQEEHGREASGMFDIHIYFSLHNWLKSVLSVYDIQARLYHVSAGILPMTIGYVRRFRVDLYADNSIIKSGGVFRAEHGSAAYFDLTFETGFYDDTGTTLAVFGLDVDFELSGPEGVSKWRIPSDKLYVLQHRGPPYAKGSEADIDAVDGARMSALYDKTKHKVYVMPDRANAQTMDRAVIYESIGKMFAIHSGRGLHRLS